MRECAHLRYMGVQLQDGTFDVNAELWTNTKIVFEWVLTSTSETKRLRTSAACSDVKKRATPPAPKIFGKVFNVAQLKKAGQQAIMKLCESLADIDKRGWALDCMCRP